MLDLDALLAAAPADPPAYEDLLTVPVSTRDLAVVVAETVPAAELVAAAREAGAPLVRERARVRPLRRASRWRQGHVSLALRLSSPTRGGR